MRILLINQYYPPDTAATGQFLADVAEGLAKSKHEVHVLCSQCAYEGGKLKTKRQDRKKMIQGQNCAGHEHIVSQIHVHRVRASGFGCKRSAYRLMDYLSFLVLASFAALRMPRMDVCMTLTTPPFVALTGWLLKKLRHTRFLLWSMDMYPEIAVAYGAIKSDGLLHRRLARLSRMLYREASGVISLGELMTKQLIKAGADPDKIVIIDNWAPGECIKRTSPGETFSPVTSNTHDGITIMYSGNLGAGHELETVVRAIQGDGTMQRYHMLFVGNLRSRRRFHTLVSRAGLDHADSRATAPLDQLSRTLAAGDIHVVSQRRKTQGLIVPSKLYGVMAAGRAILFVGPENSEAARIVLRSGAGFVVRPGDVVRTKAALREMAVNPGLRTIMGERAREYYERHYGRDRSVSRIVEFIKSCDPWSRQYRTNRSSQLQDDSSYGVVLPAVRQVPSQRSS